MDLFKFSACEYIPEHKLFKAPRYISLFMEQIYSRNLNSSGKIRHAEHLIAQIEADYQVLSQLWTRTEKGIPDTAQAESLLQRIAWIRAGFAAIEQDKNEAIEGVHTGRLGQIKRDVQYILEKIQCL